MTSGPVDNCFFGCKWLKPLSPKRRHFIKSPIGYFYLAGILILSPWCQAHNLVNFKITGLADKLSNNVTTRLNTLQKYHLQNNQTDDLQFWQKQALENIKLALEPYGYFQPIIRSRSIKQGKHWLVTYHIQAGRPIIIRHVTLHTIGEGKNDPAIDAIMSRFPIAPGEILNIEKYEKVKHKLFDIAEEYGYLDAKLLDHHILVNTKKYYADITFTFDTGKQFYFGPIEFSQTPLDKNFLMRFIDFEQNDRFIYSKLLNLQDDLSTSNYFSQVTVIGNRNSAVNHHVPIRISLIPRKSQLYSFGLGYGSDTGLRASMGWDWRWTNRYGHYMTALLSGSEQQDSLIARYVIPGEEPLLDRYFFTTGVQQEKFVTKESSIFQLGVNYQSKRGLWENTYGVNYQFERSPLIATDVNSSSTYLLPSFASVYKNTDKLYLPTKGIRLTFNVRGASKAILSKTNFFQSEFNGKWVLPFLGENRLIFRNNLGYTLSSSAEALPLSLYFRAGGPQSVRGYQARSLSDDGGRYLIVGSVEIQPHLYKNWFGALFYDVGNAFNNFPASLKRGAGVGIVWQSPIGAIELTAAKALSLHGHPTRIQFSMGPNL